MSMIPVSMAYGVARRNPLITGLVVGGIGVGGYLLYRKIKNTDFSKVGQNLLSNSLGLNTAQAKKVIEPAKTYVQTYTSNLKKNPLSLLNPVANISNVASSVGKALGTTQIGKTITSKVNTATKNLSSSFKKVKTTLSAPFSIRR